MPWDIGGIHQYIEVRTSVWLHRSRMELRRFPLCAPELNPDEGLWGALKYGRLANFCSRNFERLEAAVTAELRRLKGHPDEVMSAILQTELPIHPSEGFVKAGGPP